MRGQQWLDINLTSFNQTGFIPPADELDLTHVHFNTLLKPLLSNWRITVDRLTVMILFLMCVLNLAFLLATNGQRLDVILPFHYTTILQTLTCSYAFVPLYSSLHSSLSQTPHMMEPNHLLLLLFPH